MRRRPLGLGGSARTSPKSGLLPRSTTCCSHSLLSVGIGRVGGRADAVAWGGGDGAGGCCMPRLGMAPCAVCGGGVPLGVAIVVWLSRWGCGRRPNLAAACAVVGGWVGGVMCVRPKKEEDRWVVWCFSISLQAFPPSPNDAGGGGAEGELCFHHTEGHPWHTGARTPRRLSKTAVPAWRGMGGGCHQRGGCSLVLL